MAGDRDDSQATEEPTQKRLDDAQAHGDIVKSQEVSTFIVLGGGTLAIAIFGASAAENFVRTFRVFLEQPDQLLVDPGAIMGLMRGTLYHIALIFGPPIAFLVATALAAHMLQNPPSFAVDRLMPDLSKISPLAGLKRLFSMDSVTNLLKGMVKLAIVGTVVWTTLWPMRGQLSTVLDQSPAALVSDMSHLLMRVFIAVLSVL